LVDFLKEKSISFAVATSTARKLTIPKLQLTNLLSTFNIIIAGDEIENGKPAPDIFLAAARALNVAAEKCVVLEDSSYGIRAAHAAKMIPIMVPDLAQPTDEIRALTHAVVPSLHEAREVISQLL
jgi:HAD superfamily hydrolase (TIGR01509 family)